MRSGKHTTLVSSVVCSAISKPYWQLAAVALVLTLLANILLSTQPYFTKVAVDHFITPKNTDGIWLFAALFFAVFLFRFIFSYAQEILLNNVGQRVMFDLRTELFTKLQRQEVAYYDKYPVGRIMTRLTSDVDALNELFTSGVIDVLGDLVVIFAIITWLFCAQLEAGDRLADHRPAAVSSARIGFANTPAAALTASGHATQSSTHFCRNTSPARRPFNCLTPSARLWRRFRAINDDYRNANIETIYYYAIFYPLVDFIGAVGIAVVIFLLRLRRASAAVSVGQQALTVGVLASFIQYSQYLFQPIRDLSDKFNVLQAAIVASHRIFILLDRDIEITYAGRAEKKRQGDRQYRI